MLAGHAAAGGHNSSASAQKHVEVQREAHAVEARGGHMAAHSSPAVNHGQGSCADSLLRLMWILVMQLLSGCFVVCLCVCDTKGDACCRT